MGEGRAAIPKIAFGTRIRKSRRANDPPQRPGTKPARAVHGARHGGGSGDVDHGFRDERCAGEGGLKKCVYQNPVAACFDYDPFSLCDFFCTWQAGAISNNFIINRLRKNNPMEQFRGRGSDLCPRLHLAAPVA